MAVKKIAVAMDEETHKRLKILQKKKELVSISATIRWLLNNKD